MTVFTRGYNQDGVVVITFKRTLLVYKRDARAGALAAAAGRVMPTWDDVVEIGGRFPGVEVGTSYGTPSMNVRKKFMCRLRTNPDALVVRTIDLADAEALLKGQPDVFFITPHYENYPAVLVRLDVVVPRAAGRADRGRVAPAGAQARGRRVRRR